MLILFVEYHAAFRQASSRLMEREADMGAVTQAGSVREGREKSAPFPGCWERGEA